MTRLMLARHGETPWHFENRYTGSSDIGLTELGVAQAAKLGEWSGRQGFAAVYSSDLSRAILTATPAADAMGLPLQIDARLREVDFGEGEGKTPAEMAAAFPAARAEFELHPGHSALPGGEAGAVAVTRAWPALEEISAAHEGEDVLVVMHATLMRLILCRILDMPFDRYRSAFPGVLNAAITTVTIDREAPALHGYNVIPV